MISGRDGARRGGRVLLAGVFLAAPALLECRFEATKSGSKLEQIGLFMLI